MLNRGVLELDMKKLIQFALLVFASSAFAANVYVAQSSEGGNTGADCADARALSTLVAGDWVAGNTIHLCGTINFTAGTAGLVAQGSGTSGSPIIVQFETNAILQAPYFGGGGSCSSLGSCNAGIELYGYNDIIVDGGANGIVENTANGTNLAYQQTSAGVAVYGNNIIVRNLTVQNIYQNDPSSSDTAGASTTDVIAVQGATNITLCNSTLNAARVGLTSSAVGSATPIYPSPSCSSNTFTTGLNYFGNTLTDHCWMFLAGGTAATTVNIFNNNMSGTSNWQEAGNYYHTDGIISFGVPVTSYIYNNIFANASFTTAAVFCTYGGSSSGSDCYVFNNLFVQEPSLCCSTPNGTAIWLQTTTGELAQTHYVFNNTIINYGVALLPFGDGLTITAENNLTTTGTTGFYFYSKGFGSNSLPSILAASDYNSFYGGRGLSFAGTSYYGWPTGSWPGYSSWTTTGFDTHSVSANPNLNASYQLTSGSPAIGAATNLTSLCSTIAPLCYDAAGNARPSSGAWDIGAYNYLTGVNAGGSFGFGW